MRKLVLGIALVVCLDIAFIWMMANQPDPPEIAFSAAPQPAMPVVHDPRPVDTVPEVSEVRSSHPDMVSRVETSSVVSQQSVRNGRRLTGLKPSTESSVAATEHRDPSLNAKNLFPDKIIVIGQTEPIAEAARNRDRRPETPEEKPVAVAEATGPSQISEEKNKSFESRAFSVIKKPYLWMRALASQIR